MPVALILIDALPPAYVSHARLPVVADLAQDGWAGPLANIYAYRGIEATLFSGKLPSEHGVWGEFRPTSEPHQPDRLRDRVAHLAIWAGDLLPSDRLRLDVRYVVSRLLQGNQRIPMGNLIPWDVMPSFAASMDRPIWEDHSLGAIDTIFDELSAGGGSFETVIHPAIRFDRQIVDYTRGRVARGNLPDFWYIKFSALDALGHKYGPDTTKLAPALLELNSQLAALIATLRSAYEPNAIDIVLVSDHGMSKVERGIDVRPALKRTGLVPNRDFLYFLDSTTIRCWSKDPGVRTILIELFSNMPGMRVLGTAVRRQLHIPNDSSAGDVLVALDEGWVVAPDFFRRDAAPLGMHGYAEVATMAGLPFLAAEPALAALLPGERSIGHADVWAAMRRRLGLSVDAAQHIEGRLCTSLY